jgi:hypothetical protein
MTSFENYIFSKPRFKSFVSFIMAGSRSSVLFAAEVAGWIYGLGEYVRSSSASVVELY